MSETYLFRATFEFQWELGYTEDIVPEPPKLPRQLPIEFGPFRLDQSPNAELYLEELGWINPSPLKALSPDHNYPVSLLYIETQIRAKEGYDPEGTADETFEQLEAMLRLFQEGDISLRRHYSIFHLKEGKPEWIVFLEPRPIKPEPAALYPRGPYKLDDETLRGFVGFFNSYWDIINQMHQPIYNALFRFNSSYERRTLSDRLIELMIAMEALFGDKEYHRYKIPLRCACMLYPPGKERKRVFTTIKGFYDTRSKIVHGGKLELATNIEGEVDRFEQYVRRSILKFLERHKDGCPITSGSELDDLLFFGKK